jgi:hypothetical protein
MPLSVNIILEVVNADVKPTNPDLKLHIRSNGMSGVAYTDWETFIAGGEATGFLEAPKGKGLRTSRKRLKEASMQQELESAQALGGHRQTGSGARPGNKGDGQVLDQSAIDNLEAAPGRFRIENKFATGASTTLRLSELQKIRAECQGHETPVFDVQFKDRNTLRTLDNWVLIPRREWEKLASQADDNR